MKPAPVRRRNRGLTLLEVLFVLILLALAFALVAPSFGSPAPPEESMQRVIDAARRVAVQRAQAVTLSFESDGGWALDGGGEADPVRLDAGSLDEPVAGPVRLRISPLGACTVEPWPGPGRSPAIDPVRCRLSGR